MQINVTDSRFELVFHVSELTEFLNMDSPPEVVSEWPAIQHIVVSLCDSITMYGHQKATTFFVHRELFKLFTIEVSSQ